MYFTHFLLSDNRFPPDETPGRSPMTIALAFDKESGYESSSDSAGFAVNYRRVVISIFIRFDFRCGEVNLIPLSGIPESGEFIPDSEGICGGLYPALIDGRGLVTPQADPRGRSPHQS
jgi:hypothetical protein